jgi:hypothetical protein
MRRPAPTLPISPKQLKHFAAATVAITLLLALFAGGEDAGLAAQIQARETRNQLIENEATKLGTKQLKANLKLKDSSKSQFAFSDGGDVVDMSSEWGSGGGGGGGTARPKTPGVKDVAPARSKLPKTPGQSVSLSGPEGVPDGAKPAENRAKKAPKKAVEHKPVTQPSEQELDKALEASRQRSGHEEPSDD